MAVTVNEWNHILFRKIEEYLSTIKGDDCQSRLCPSASIRQPRIVV